MAGIRGKSGPPGNQNAFRHALAGISQRRANSALTPADQSIREEILEGLINDKGGEEKISTAMRVLAEVIASDAAWLVAVNRAIDGVMESNQKARNNPKALNTLDGYKPGAGEQFDGESSAVWISKSRQGCDPAGNHRCYYSTSALSAFVPCVMKEQVTTEKQLQQRVRKIEEALTKSKKRTCPP